MTPAQFTATNGASLRLEWLWMYRATTSLPTPLSPVIRTLAGLSAARAAMASSSVMAALATTKLGCSRGAPARAGDADEMACMVCVLPPRAWQTRKRGALAHGA